MEKNKKDSICPFLVLDADILMMGQSTSFNVRRPCSLLVVTISRAENYTTESDILHITCMANINYQVNNTFIFYSALT